jgi:hypothetical protein
MKKLLSVALAAVMCVAAGNAMAEEKKKKTLAPKSPVNSVDGVLYPQGQIGVILKSVFMNKDGLYDGDSEINTLAPNTPKEKEIAVYNLIARYGVIDNFELKVKIPYKDWSIEREEPVTKPEFDNSGLSDSTVWARYQILSQKRKDPLFLWAGLGLNIPTGKTDDKTNGKLDPMTMQVGDGSWDPIVDFGITKKIGGLKLNAYASYTFSQEGDNDYRWGDTFQFDLSSVYCLNEWVALDMELNSVWKDKNEQNGTAVDTTGGFQMYLTPGVHLMFPGTKHHLALGVPITVYRDLNGPQLSEDYRVVLKAAFVF